MKSDALFLCSRMISGPRTRFKISSRMARTYVGSFPASGLVHQPLLAAYSKFELSVVIHQRY